MINFYEALRIELHPEIGVTIVFPGLIENGNTNPNPDLLAEVFYYHHITNVCFPFYPCLSEFDELVSLQKQEWSQVVAIESAAECAKAVVNGICKVKTFVAEPSWVRVLFWLSAICPELLISKPKKN